MRVFHFVVVVAIAVGSVGCQSKLSTPPIATSYQTNVLVGSEPEGAMPVGEARETTIDGDEVTLVGRIGGSAKPFVDGLAAFTIVDLKVPYCEDETPWDYCCHTDEVKDNIATIKIVDDAGKPIAHSARDLLNAKEFSTVVVKGKAKRDDAGNLTVAANQVFVREGE